MAYDPTGLYPMGFDPHSMHSSGTYMDPTNMYVPQPIPSATEVRKFLFNQSK
jgi:hypothetical protein